MWIGWPYNGNICNANIVLCISVSPSSFICISISFECLCVCVWIVCSDLKKVHLHFPNRKTSPMITQWMQVLISICARLSSWHAIFYFFNTSFGIKLWCTHHTLLHVYRDLLIYIYIWFAQYALINNTYYHSFFSFYLSGANK